MWLTRSWVLVSPRKGCVDCVFSGKDGGSSVIGMLAVGCRLNAGQGIRDTKWGSVVAVLWLGIVGENRLLV